MIYIIRDNEYTYSKIQYKSDFEVTYNDGIVEVLDTKGVETSIFRLKRRLLLERYPNINFYCVKKVKGKWIKY